MDLVWANGVLSCQGGLSRGLKYHTSLGLYLDMPTRSRFLSVKDVMEALKTELAKSMEQARQ